MISTQKICSNYACWPTELGSSRPFPSFYGLGCARIWRWCRAKCQRRQSGKRHSENLLLIPQPSEMESYFSVCRSVEQLNSWTRWFFSAVLFFQSRARTERKLKHLCLRGASYSTLAGFILVSSKSGPRCVRIIAFTEKKAQFNYRESHRFNF